MKLGLLILFLGSAVATENFIVGGEDVTDKGKWPWQGSLRTYGGHMCGISLISPTWGVTAAHCVNGESVADLSALFGVNYFDDQSGQHVYVKQFIMHECFMVGESVIPNDIAVVEFKRPVVMGDNIAAVPLAPARSEHAGNPDCWITGWGYTSGNGDFAEILQEAHIDVYSNGECSDVWADDIGAGNVCIGDEINGKASCSGDSGGPLVCRVDGRFELVGATSWGIRGCWAIVPSVYTRVAHYRDWIAEKTGV